MKTFVNAILVGVVALAFSGVAQADTIYADARANFVAATTGQTTQSATANPLGLTDTLGSGYWNYYAISSSVPSTATSELLTWGMVSDLGSNGGYGGKADHNTPGVSTNKIFPDGITPNNNELAIHPGNTAATEAVMLRWTAGAAESTDNLAITLTLTRNMDITPYNETSSLYVYVNNVLKYSLTTGDNLSHSYSLSGLTIEAGQTVDFVYDRDKSYSSDEARLSASISVPEPSTLALLAGGLIGLIAYAWRKRK